MFKTHPGGNGIDSQINIRPATALDYEDIIQLFHSWTPKDWDTDKAKKYFDDFFNDSDSQDKVFVGLIENQIVGVCGYCPDEEQIKGIYWLNWFYVHKDLTGHGSGRKLLGYVIGKLQAKNASDQRQL